MTDPLSLPQQATIQHPLKQHPLKQHPIKQHPIKQYSLTQHPLIQHRITHLLNRATGLALQAIGYGGARSHTPSVEHMIVAPTNLCEAQMRAEMAGELRIHSISGEA